MLFVSFHRDICNFSAESRNAFNVANFGFELHRTRGEMKIRPNARDPAVIKMKICSIIKKRTEEIWDLLKPSPSPRKSLNRNNGKFLEYFKLNLAFEFKLYILKTIY